MVEVDNNIIKVNDKEFNNLEDAFDYTNRTYGLMADYYEEQYDTLTKPSDLKELVEEQAKILGLIKDDIQFLLDMKIKMQEMEESNINNNDNDSEDEDSNKGYQIVTNL